MRLSGGGGDDPIREGIGCLLYAIAGAIVLWACNGFPGLPR